MPEIDQHQNFITATLNRLNNRKTQAILLKVNVHTHTVLKAYAHSLHQSMNTVVDSLLQEFVKTVEPQIRVAFQVPEPLVPQGLSKELKNRYMEMKEAELAHQPCEPHLFGLEFKEGSNKNSIKSYALLDHPHVATDPNDDPI